jgi:hypothetical protein
MNRPEEKITVRLFLPDWLASQAEFFKSLHCNIYNTG